MLKRKVENSTIIHKPATDHTTKELVEALANRDPSEVEREQKAYRECIENGKKETEKQKKILEPLHDDACMKQGHVDKLRQELLKPHTASEQLNIQYEISQTLKERDDIYNEMQRIKETWKK